MLPLVAAAAVLLGACGGGSGGAPANVPLDFPTDAFLSMATAGGALTMELRSSPQPPARGNDAVEASSVKRGGAGGRRLVQAERSQLTIQEMPN